MPLELSVATLKAEHVALYDDLHATMPDSHRAMIRRGYAALAVWRDGLTLFMVGERREARVVMTEEERAVDARWHRLTAPCFDQGWRPVRRIFDAAETFDAVAAAGDGEPAVRAEPNDR